MPKSVSNFDELRIRDFPLDKKVRLMELASQEEKSLNQFLYDHLVELSEQSEVKAIDERYAEVVKEVVFALNLCTEEMKKVQELYRFVMGE
ncbi:hypothetical protein [Enterococcus innesii]|uniref:hypothetical protein n=1 Tax=Enterococcus innesii TaxID=2839759 RepID=UPI0034A42850